MAGVRPVGDDMKTSNPPHARRRSRSSSPCRSNCPDFMCTTNVAAVVIQSVAQHLLQHATKPVDWWPWGEEAMQEAKRRDVPVLISVGYAACHWCH
jgi:hypothetical protein